MERKFDRTLKEWAVKKHRKPLLLRGARQTGKTYAVRKLGATFPTFIEINFEQEPRFRRLFQNDLDIQRILREIGALLQKKIEPGTTLLFFDEIQICPEVVTALRYFFELMPDLHVIGAGSLLEFELRNLSVPVGRITFAYVRPLTFEEYLRATNRGSLADEIGAATPQKPPGQLIHEASIDALREYLYIGGMPGVISAFRESGSILTAEEEQRDIIQTYRADFSKYTGRTGIERIEKVFNAIPPMAGSKTVFSEIDPDARTYQTKGAYDLLEMARVIAKVRNSTGAGLPLSAGASDKHFKSVFLDVGLSQRLLAVDYKDWSGRVSLLDRHRGAVAEQFVGQELMHRAGDYEDPGLYYWHRMSAGSQAEVDYLVEAGGSAVPVEVKSATAGHLRSMRQYLDMYKNIGSGVKCSLDPFGRSGDIVNIPLYAAGRIAELAVHA
jgi:predicted AAA+ superfamily ATPase